MSYERVSTPAFWIDYQQYLKALGFFNRTWGWGNYSGETRGRRIPLWDMNPSNMINYDAYEESSGWTTTQTLAIQFLSNVDWINAPINYKLQIARLYDTANFAGLLGHNLYSSISSGGSNPGWMAWLPYFSGAYYEPENAYPGQPAGQQDGAYNRLNHATDGTDKVYGGVWDNEQSQTNPYIQPTSDGYILADFSLGLRKKPEVTFEDVYYTYPTGYDADGDGVPDDIAGTSLTTPIYGYDTLQNIRPFIRTFDGTDMSVGDTVKMGSHVLGRKFTMPTAPNMSLTQEYVFDGTKTQTSRGGSTLTNTLWHSPPNWGDLPAWGRSNTGDPAAGGVNGILNQSNFLGGRRGRRTWKLKFSFIPEADVFPEYILKSDGVDGFHDMSGIVDLATDTHSPSDTLYGILSLTLGGALKFIFQPDKDEDNFAIVRFDQKSIKLTQSSHRTYDFSCKLEEVW